MRQSSLPLMLVLHAALWGPCCAATEPEERSKTAGVSSARLRKAAEEPGNWLMYSGQYNSRRHSSLMQINDKNVHQLGVKWVRQFPTLSLIETSPLVEVIDVVCRRLNGGS